jgi:hypothetical protein
MTKTNPKNTGSRMPKPSIFAVLAFCILAGHGEAFAAYDPAQDALAPPTIWPPDQHPPTITDPKMIPVDHDGLGPVNRGPAQWTTTIPLPRHFQLLFHHDLAHNDTKAYVVLLDDEDFPNPLPAVGDILVIDTYTVKVTSRVFSRSAEASLSCDLCDLKIYTDPVPPSKKPPQ